MGLIKVINKETNQITWEESNDSEVYHGVDISGKYIGLVDKQHTELHSIVPYAPPNASTDWVWENGNWKYYKPLAIAKSEALEYIEVLAGGARSRYITVSPGQESVYNLKKAKAEDYSSRYYATSDFVRVPPIIMSEAEVLKISPIAVAETILTKAAEWELKAAEIEKIRIAAKAAILACTSIEELGDVMENTTDTLRTV